MLFFGSGYFWRLVYRCGRISAETYMPTSCSWNCMNWFCSQFWISSSWIMQISEDFVSRLCFCRNGTRGLRCRNVTSLESIRRTLQIFLVLKTANKYPVIIRIIFVLFRSLPCYFRSWPMTALNNACSYEGSVSEWEISELSPNSSEVRYIQIQKVSVGKVCIHLFSDRYELNQRYVSEKISVFFWRDGF